MTITRLRDDYSLSQDKCSTEGSLLGVQGCALHFHLSRRTAYYTQNVKNISTIHSYNQLLIKDMLSCFQAPYMASAQKNWTKQMDRTWCLKIYILLPRLNVKEERCKQPYYSMYVCASKVKAAMQQCIAQCGYN